MSISSRTPEGTPHRCPVCGANVRIEPSHPGNDAPCPQCGNLLLFDHGAPRVGPGSDARSMVVQCIAMIALAVLPAVVAAACLWWFAGPVGVLGLGSTEVFIIIFIGILLFGRRLPEFGQYLGRRMVGENGR